MKTKKIFAVILFTLEIIFYQSLIIFLLALFNFHKLFKFEILSVFIPAFIIYFIHFNWLYIYTYKKTCLALRLLKFKINYNEKVLKLPPLYTFIGYYITSYLLIIPERFYYILYAKFNYLLYKTPKFNFNIIKYIYEHLIYFNNTNVEGFFTVKIMFLISSFIYFIIQIIRKNERLTFSMNKYKFDLIEE